MASDLLLSVVIVNFNGLAVIENCLNSVIAAQAVSEFPLEIIVVDNASVDDSVALIKEKFPQVKLFMTRQNLGFAGGCNYGLQHCEGSYIYFLNNDAMVLTDTFSEALSYLAANQEVGVVGSLILDENKPGCIDVAGSYMMINGFLQHSGINDQAEKYVTPAEYFSIKGAGFVLARATINEAGYLFDDRYFAYLEETDLCWRVLLTGKKVVLLPQSKIKHVGGYTSKRLNYEFIEFNSFKNRTCNLLKNLNLLEMILVLPLHLATLTLILIVFLLRRNIPMVKAISKSLVWNVQNFPETLAYRRRFYRKDTNNVSFRRVSSLRLLASLHIPDIKQNVLFLLSYLRYRESSK
jgi:GT2 family glycosyltransferase